MILEYFEDPEGDPARVVLLHSPTAAEVAGLRDDLSALAGRPPGAELRLDRLSGLVEAGGCSLVACLGVTDLGVEPDQAGDRSFRCVLSQAGWIGVVGLLGPFLTPDPGRRRFQYLTEVGPIEWIVSESRSW